MFGRPSVMLPTTDGSIHFEHGRGKVKITREMWSTFQQSLSVIRAGCVLVLDHLLGLVRDGLVDLLECLLSIDQVVVLKELMAFLCEAVELPRVALLTLVIIQGDFLHDVGIDQFLDVLVDGRIAHTGIQISEFVHRWELLGVSGFVEIPLFRHILA